MSNTAYQVKKKKEIRTPREDQFWMPGEFAVHRGCWMLWPERVDWWRVGARPAQAAFAAVAVAIARFEPVRMGVSAEQYPIARAMLPASIDVIRLDYNDSWMRDNGPTYVTNGKGEIRGIDWDFNAWGGHYRDFAADDALAKQVLALDGIGRYKAPLVMEGGSIDVDGDGTLIVTEQCLLNPNRNPHLNRDEIEAYLVAYLNVEKVIWLQNGVYNDETSGHVDNLCCFVRPTVVALTWTDDESDPQHAISQAAYEQLSQMCDAKGRPLTVHKIHQPTPIYFSAEEIAGIAQTTDNGTRPRKVGDRLAASYINYYVANGGVVVPQFGDQHDAAALTKIAALFPDREVVGVFAREILLGGGNIHCITQQIPQG